MPADDFDEPRPAPRMTFLAAAAWSLGLGIAASVLVLITEGARPGAASDLVNLTVCRLVACLLFLFVMLRIYAPNASIRDVLGLRSVSIIAGVLAAAVGALVSPGLSLIDDAIYARYPLPAEETDLLEKLMNVTSRGERFVLFASFVLVIPLCEELFYRGVLFRALRRGRPEGLAVLGTALLFALSRGDPRSLPTGLVLGLMTTWLRGRSGSLFPALLSHAALNAVPLVPLALGKGEVTIGGRVAVGSMVAAGVCAWLAALIFGRDATAEDARLRDA
jgi:membrane protease YdiL (CAAX protease family)